MNRLPPAVDPEPEEIPVTCAEAGRRGGMRVKEKLGREHYVRIGTMGGNATKAAHAQGYYQELGALGGAAIAAKGDPARFAELGKKGGAKVREAFAALRREQEQEKAEEA